MNICIIGTGYVGLVTGACFADLGNRVFCVDSDRKKIDSLKRGVVPIYEPGLEEMVRGNMKKGRLSFSTNIKESVKKSTIIFICVGTPSAESGEPDLTALEAVAREIAKSMNSYKLIVEKSTVPVETGEWVKRTIDTLFASGAKKREGGFDVASNPEFLREGSAIKDFKHPDRIVIGTGSEKAKKILLELYKPLKAPIVVTDIKSAEIIKHASNSFLSMKISFINAISVVCDKTGADIKKVARGMGMDKRIGTSFLEAGIGFGGSCFPKDLDAFIHIADRLGYNFSLLREVKKINSEQKNVLIHKISQLVWNIAGKTIGVFGLSFKPDTDDIRNSPPIDIIRMLFARGAKIRAYDPKAAQKSRDTLARLCPGKKKEIVYCKDAYDAAKGCDCLVVLTDWNEFKELDFAKLKKLLKNPAIVDGRNIYDPEMMKKMGFTYIGIGRR
ncbi:MAG: UDP-glucose/GDP-mannose dehydrogenase family protein [Omnitrophica bacterium]|nr:UDP-glucose/GDP-mannose dehydrogenase family protein [Candidatus Omnitrophota bacterium]